MHRIPSSTLRTPHPAEASSPRAAAHAATHGGSRADARGAFGTMLFGADSAPLPVPPQSAWDSTLATPVLDAGDVRRSGSAGSDHASPAGSADPAKEVGDHDGEDPCRCTARAEDDASAPAERAEGPIPDTIAMLNELLLIGGPSRRAAAELTGDAPRSPAGSKAPSAEERSRRDAPGQDRTAGDGAPGQEGRSTLVNRGPQSPSLTAAGLGGEGRGREGDRPAGTGSDASSVRSTRNTDAHNGGGNNAGRQDRGSASNAIAVSSDAALAPLKSFAAIHARQNSGAQPSAAASPGAAPATGAVPGMVAGPVAGHISARRSAQPASLAQAAPSPAGQMYRGLSAAMKSDAAGGSAMISLRPESLGAVTVRVDVSNGSVSASFQTATPMARDLLNRSLVELRELLHSRGLNVDHIDVSLRDEPHESNAPGPARTDAQPHAQGNRGGPSQDEVGHSGGGESQSQHFHGGAGEGPGGDDREGRARMPGRYRDGRSETFESAEPVAEQVGEAPGWQVDTLVDTLV